MALPDPSERGKCRECGTKIAGNRYYCDEHKPSKKPPTRKNRAQKVHANITETPIRIPADIADAGGRRNDKTKPPSQEATANMLGRLLVYLSAFLAAALVAGDPDVRTDADQEALAGRLALSEDQAKDIMHPISRILTPTGVWQKYGGSIVNNSDVLASLVALYEWGSELVRYKRNRAARITQYQKQAELQAAPLALKVQHVEAQQDVYSGPQQGVVLGPDAQFWERTEGVKVSRKMLEEQGVVAA